MDFSFTEEQLGFKQAVAKFARENLNDSVSERDERGEFSRECWRQCAEFGLLGVPIPKEYGGAEADFLTAVLAMEGLGYGCRDGGLIFALGAQMWSVQLPILEFGSSQQKSAYLPGLCSGAIIGAHGMTEPEAGSNAFSLKTRAVQSGDDYVLNGTKTMVTNASVADLAIIFASTDPTKGQWGLTAFLVPRDTPGFSVGRDFKKLGLRTAPLGEIILTDCRVPATARLGAEGAGASLFTYAMECERAAILAGHVGTMERQLEDCIRYAQERRQFDQPIGKFQSVSNRIADMKVRLETSRLLLYMTAWQRMQKRSVALEAAITKLYLSECLVQSSLDAIRVHGGYGFMAEFAVERDLRDAVGGTLYSGTSDIQRQIIARLLGL